MATIVNCPECEQQVMLPASGSPQARVMCPLCRAEYTLDAVLQNLPPQLVLLDAPAVETATVWAAEDDLEVEPWAPVGRNEIAVPRDAPSSVQGTVEFGDLSESNFSPARPRTDSVRGIPTMAPLPKPRHRSSVIRQMIGVVGGGVLGLSLGYIALLWMGGQSKDFLKIGHKLPSFLTPSSFHEDAETTRAAVDAPSQFDELANKFSSFESPNQPPAEEPADVPPKRSKRKPMPAVPAESEFAIEPHRPTESAEPAAPQEPAAEPAGPIAVSKVSIPSAAKFTPSDLGVALGAALEHRDGIEQGTLLDSKAKKVEAFKAYCDLAQTLTFVEGKDSEDQLGPRKKAARDLVQRVADNEQALLDVAQLSNLWITSAKRTKPGVLLAGKVLEIKQQGDAYALLVTPVGHASQFKIVTTTRPAVNEGDRAIVMGSIVDDPTTIVGYEVTPENQLTADNVLDPAAAPTIIFSQLIVMPKSDSL